MELHSDCFNYTAAWACTEHLTDDELKDPRTNAQIAMPHLMKGYKRGVQKGLTDFALLKYIANTSDGQEFRPSGRIIT